MIAYICAAFARLGFNITDEGLVLDWSYRMLHGAIPHRDFITPIPVGSGVIHMIDFMSPFPLFLSSRVIGIVELVAYSTILVSLVVRTPFRRWGVPHFLAVLAASLIDLHVFPPMAWYTIDGILLCAIGARALVGRPADQLTPARAAVAMACFGAAAVTKQSFLPALVLGLLTVAFAARHRARREAARMALVAVAAALAPLAAYATWIGTAGGLSQLVQQVAGTRPVMGTELLTDFFDPRLGVAWILAVYAAAVTSRELRKSEAAVAGGTPSRARRVMVVASIATMLVVVPVGLGRLGRDAPWGSMLQWLLIVSLVVDFASRGTGRRQLAGVWILGISQMVRLSYGWRNPDLVAGVIVVYMLARTWTSPATLAALESRRFLDGRSRSSVALCLVLGIAVVVLSYSARTHDVYRDVKASQLTYRLDGIAPAYAGLVTGPDTFRYEQELAACIRTHPAARISVVPDNPSAPTAFQYRPLMPITLLEPDTYSPSRDELVRFAAAAPRSGSYLLLIQTWFGPPQALTAATAQSQVQDYGDPGFARRLYGTFAGTRIACGSLVGIYYPGAGN